MIILRTYFVHSPFEKPNEKHLNKPKKKLSNTLFLAMKKNCSVNRKNHDIIHTPLARKKGTSPRQNSTYREK